MKATLRFLAILGLLFAGFEMLAEGLLFEPAYNAGFPPWLHTTVGLATAVSGLIGLIRMSTLLPWHRAYYGFQKPAVRKISIALAVLAFSASWVWARFRPLPVVPGASREAVVFFDDALWHMERFYLRRDGVDWPNFRRQAYRRIEGVQTPPQTFDAIRATLAALGKDAHNELVDANWRKELEPVANGLARAPAITARLTKDGVAYVSVPGFPAASRLGSLYRLGDPKGRRFAHALHEKLTALDAMDPIGWIVDLSGESGGSMWPMLDGMAPLIGEGRVAALDMPQFNRRVDTWIVGGNSYSGTPWFADRSSGRPTLKHGAAPIAILTGPGTASAGEGVLVAFKGRAHTRQFGRPTAGLTTSPDGYALGHGVVLFVTIARQVDRLGRIYDGPIPPDEAIAGSGREDASPIIAEATRWIKKEAVATR